MRLIIFLVFLLVLVLSLSNCKTMETKPGEQYDKPVRERPMREFNDFHRGKGKL